MIREDMNLLAESVVRLLHSRNAIRPEDDEENIPDYVTVREICDELHLYVGDWQQLARYMYQHGYPLCHKPGKGHYLGGNGEQICKTYYKWRMAKGWTLKFAGIDRELREASAESRRWMERSFKVTSVDEMEAEYVVRSENAQE